jgi:hypothetical protein
MSSFCSHLFCSLVFSFPFSPFSRLYIYGGGFKSDFGGGTLTYFHDMAILDLLTLRWVLPDIQGAIPAGAWSHGLVVAGDSAYLVGGCTDDGFSDLVYRLRFDQKVMPENIYMSGPGLETNTTAGVETYFLIETREVLPLATPQSATKTAVRRTRAEGSNEKAAHTASAGRKNTGKARDFDILMTSDHQARRPTRQANQKKQAKKAAASSSKHVARTTILHAPSSHVASFSGHPHGRSLLSASKAASDPASAGFGPLLPWGTQQQFLVQLINEDRTLTRAQVTELGGGRYNVSYTLGHGFMFSLLIKLANTVLVTAAPLIVYNNPQGPDAVAGGVILTADSAIKGETLTAKLQLLDQLGNEIRRGGDVKGAVVDDATGAVSPTASHTVGLLLYIFASSDLSTPALVSDSSLRLLGIKDHADGTYAVEFRVPEGSFDYYAVQIVWDGVSVPAVTTLNASPMPVVLRAYDQSELSADLVVVGYVLTSICVAVVLGYMVILSIHSEARVVKASSYFFLMTLCSGVLLCFIAAFLLSITTDASCRAYPLVLGFGYNLLIGSLFVKSQRIMSIFTTKRLQVQNLSNLRTGIPIALLLAAELIFAIAWLASSPLSRVGRPNTNNPYQTYVHCDGKLISHHAASTCSWLDCSPLCSSLFSPSQVPARTGGWRSPSWKKRASWCTVSTWRRRPGMSRAPTTSRS